MKLKRSCNDGRAVGDQLQDGEENGKKQLGFCRMLLIFSFILNVKDFLSFSFNKKRFLILGYITGRYVTLDETFRCYIEYF